MRIVHSKRAILENLKDMGFDADQLIRMADKVGITVALEKGHTINLIFNGEGGQFRAYWIKEGGKPVWKTWGDKIPGRQSIERVLDDLTQSRSKS